MTHVTCRLTAKYRDQLLNPTLGNRVWATFTFYLLCINLFVCCIVVKVLSVFCSVSSFYVICTLLFLAALQDMLSNLSVCE